MAPKKGGAEKKENKRKIWSTKKLTKKWVRRVSEASQTLKCCWGNQGEGAKNPNTLLRVMGFGKDRLSPHFSHFPHTQGFSSHHVAYV